MSIVLQSIQSEELLIVDKSPFLEVKTSSTFKNNYLESNLKALLHHIYLHVDEMEAL